MKKILTASVALATIFSASAAFNGAQVGINLGLGHMGADYKDKVTTDKANTQPTFGASANQERVGVNVDHSKLHFNGGLFAKYTHMMGENVTVGVDIFGRWQNVKAKNDYDFQTTSDADATKQLLTNHRELKSTFAFGGGLNIGMVMGTTHAYLKLAAVAARFKSTGYWVDNSANSAWTGGVANAKDVNQYIPELKKTKVGFAPGLGMEYAINESLMIALEASHEIFGKIDTADLDKDSFIKTLEKDGSTQVNDGTDNYGFIVTGRSFRPRNTRVAINIGWKFM